MDPLRALLEEDVLAAAQALLGTHLVHGPLRARIVETEAYRHDDPGCHAFGKSRMKNMVLFGEPGRAYVYFTYGMHWMLNLSALPEGQAGGILIRAAEPLEGLERMYERRAKALRPEDLLSGPGKLASAFGIASGHNGLPLLDSRSELRLEAGTPVGTVRAGTRIGLAPGRGDDLPWRFVDAESLRWVSRPHPKGL
jgi:DNA-3-methyladenine glycosylase